MMKLVLWKFLVTQSIFLQKIPCKSCRVHFRWPFLLLLGEQKNNESLVLSSVWI